MKLDQLLQGRRTTEHFERLPEIKRREALLPIQQKLGRRYAKCTFANYEVENERQERIRDAIVNHVTDDTSLRSKSVVLFGDPGTGEDHLLAATLLWAVTNHGLSVNWSSGPGPYSRLRNSISTDSESEQTIVRDLTRPSLLGLSDPFPPRGDISKFNSEILYQVFDERYRQCKPILVTMNVDSDGEAADKLSKNLVDRLKDNSLCLYFDWPSHRKPATLN